MLTRHRLTGGHRIVGRRIGLASSAVQAQLGVAQPDFGVLFNDMAVVPGAVVDTARLLQSKIEAEIAFMLGEDLDGAALDGARARAAVEHVVPALKIVDSRIAGWDITFTDTVADNASSGLFVLGPERLPYGDRDLRDVEMTMIDEDGEPWYRSGMPG